MNPRTLLVGGLLVAIAAYRYAVDEWPVTIVVEDA